VGFGSIARAARRCGFFTKAPEASSTAVGLRGLPNGTSNFDFVDVRTRAQRGLKSESWEDLARPRFVFVFTNF
jgi:hypothetical protein